MDIPAEKVIERYAQELARVQQQLFIAQAALEAYETAESGQTDTIQAND